ncbi:MAG TPA: hypothetical protein VMA72_04235 [Streptosporangiaceae bacterium]|nr:hypothetical protein [Streptosporangiaceae bacterium]
MEEAALDQLRQLVEDEVKARFPGGAIERVALLQYGDEPVVEPGELVLRVFVAAPGGREEREQVAEDFTRSFGRELEKFREDLAAKLPEARRLEIRFGADDGDRVGIVLSRPARSVEARALAGGELTPVMARLGPTDLETLDTLITAGIATNRADAVRWALARIRERPAYEQLRARAREIEELKAQF